MTGTPASAAPARDLVHYPESDGKPMAENTLQFEWIVTIKENLDAALPDAFVAGDLFWYPVEGDNRTVQAPDVMVAFGRPKGHRGSYMQWVEGGVAPQVVFEVWSPGNTIGDAHRKFSFYQRFGVQEYYLYDPDRRELVVWIRRGEGFVEAPAAREWTSPALGVRFELGEEGLRMFHRDGTPFRTFGELARSVEQERQRAEQERQRAEQERQRADQERQRADQERQRADQERQRAEALAARLKGLGADPGD